METFIVTHDDVSLGSLNYCAVKAASEVLRGIRGRQRPLSYRTDDTGFEMRESAK